MRKGNWKVYRDVEMFLHTAGIFMVYIYNMKSLATFFFAFFIVSFAFAQKGQITGAIHEKPSAPIPFVTVTLKGNTENPVSKSLSDSKGVFSLENIAPGHYTISYTLLGFKPISQPVEVKPNEVKHLGIIILESDSKLLQEVLLPSVHP